MDACHGLGHDVVVLGGVQRHGDAVAGREVPRPQTGGEHDDRRVDRSPRGLHADHPGALHHQAGDLGVLGEDGPASDRTSGQGDGRVDRTDHRITREVDRADDVADVGQRPEAGHVARPDVVHLDAEVPGHRRGAAELLEPGPVVATEIAPGWWKPVAWPVSASSVR